MATSTASKLLAWQSTNASHGRFRRFPVLGYRGHVPRRRHDAEHLAASCHRDVGPRQVLGVVLGDHRPAVAVADAPATDAIISGFRVAAPGGPRPPPRPRRHPLPHPSRFPCRHPLPHPPEFPCRHPLPHPPEFPCRHPLPHPPEFPCRRQYPTSCPPRSPGPTCWPSCQDCRPCRTSVTWGANSAPTQALWSPARGSMTGLVL